MPGKLNVFLHHSQVGELTQDNSGNIHFTYSKLWIEDPNASAISSSLPLRREPFDAGQCRGFFAGILPEGRNLDTIARHFGISSANDFAVLERIGGECAGAVTLLPVGETLAQTEHSYQPLPISRLAEVLRSLPRRPLLAGSAGVRLSLAGVQDKVPVMIKDGKMYVPVGNAPSSHILKPDLTLYPGLVYNEELCLRLANKVGVRSAVATVQTVEDINYLLVERYDRTTDPNGNLSRIHQEDFCQAMGVAPERKYQREVGPSLKDCFDLLRKNASVPALDLKSMLDAVIFNFLIGNNDAHGKNYSLLRSGKKISFAPLYDLVCTAYYPELSSGMAMKIGGEYDSDQVYPRHFEKFSAETGFAGRMVLARVTELADDIVADLETAELQNDTARGVQKLIISRCKKIKQKFA